MQCTKIDEAFQKQLQYLPLFPLLRTIASDIKQYGGTTYLVGGAVRDMILNLPIKDLDIEVHGIALEQLQTILSTYGPVSLVGKVYGVLKVHGIHADWSVPRSDAHGRKPMVTLDPYLDIRRAFERRDLTMNAMGIDILTLQLIDPFNGLADIQARVLRTPNAELFVHDPLRFYRVMQFVARFAMQPDEQLNELCAHMDISTVSKERIEAEYAKWLLKSHKPSLALDWLQTIGRLAEIFPEVAACADVDQNRQWHPEGDVLEHTKQALDAAAQFDYDSSEQKLIIMYAALCHDLGKAVTTRLHEGRLTSYGHEVESVPLAKKLLRRCMNNEFIIKSVLTLVRYHMMPLQLLTSKAKGAAYKRLANKLAPDVTIHMLAKLAMADRLGRNGKRGQPLQQNDPEIEVFIERAQQANVYHYQEEPILKGADLMPEIQPGPLMGKLLKEAYTMQIDEGITDKEKLKQRVLHDKR